MIDALAEGGVQALRDRGTAGNRDDRQSLTAARIHSWRWHRARCPTARRAIGAGARFVVSPVFRTEVIAAGHAQDVPVMPGCFTPTEILSAWDAGADVIKVFPATVVGPGYFKDVRAPLPQVKLMPTGGVTVENAGDWIRAGAVAVGVGSALLDAKAIASDTMTPIVEAAKRIVANVRAARASM